jgi:hypothetical protein
MKIKFIILGAILLNLTLVEMLSVPAFGAVNHSYTHHALESSYQTLESSPTKTPRPTHTPVPTPPPSDPGRSNIMVGLSTLIVVIILIGVWLNRRKVT